MLEKIDLSKEMGKQDYQQLMTTLEPRLGELQRAARAAGVPVIIVFEGWDAAGKGTLINRLMLSLDARGFKVNPTHPSNEEERLRPFLWRFWCKTPAKGRIAIFDQSWYERVLEGRVSKRHDKAEWTRAYGEINAFERQLAEDGAVIVKFFLHIAKEEQAKRFAKLRRSTTTAWKVTPTDLKQQKQYGKYAQAIEDMLAQTDTQYAPWTLVEAHDKRFATAKVFARVIDAIQQRLDQTAAPAAPAPRGKATAKPEETGAALASGVLGKVNVRQSLSPEGYEKQKAKLQKRLFELEHEVYLQRMPVVIVYEGWDAAGKGGNIRRLCQGMDPRGYEVIPIAAPNDVEKSHHYLWRFWTNFPKAGHITIFDRSWYGRVMVERVEGFCREAEWKRAYREINEMEQQWTDYGTAVIKFWLHIDPDEQLKRFQERQQTPDKDWKITDEDWRNRDKWPQYEQAVNEMLWRTSTTCAPWTIIEANDKLYSRIKALRTVVDTLEQRLNR